MQPLKTEPVNTFSLQAQFEARVEPPKDAPMLIVSRPRAHPGFDTSRMAYVRKPYELEYFSRNLWVDTPEKMLAPLLVRALEASGAFRAVSQAPGSVSGELRLDTEIVRLQQEFISSPSRLRLTLRVQLIDMPGKRVLATREFDVVENASSDDPYGGVVAANRAVARVLNEVAVFSAAQARASKP